MPSFMCWVGSKTDEGDDVCIYVVDPRASCYIADDIYDCLRQTSQRAGKKYMSDGIFDLDVGNKQDLHLKFRPEERLLVSEMKKLLFKPNQSLLCVMDIYEFKSLQLDSNLSVRFSNIKQNQIVKVGFFAPMKLEKKSSVSPKTVDEIDDVFEDALKGFVEVPVAESTPSPLNRSEGTPENTPDAQQGDCHPGCSMS